MQRGTSQKVAVVVLGIITLVLVGLSIFFAISLQQQQAPPDTGAAGPTQACSVSNLGAKVCLAQTNWECIRINTTNSYGWLEQGPDTRACTLGQSTCETGQTGYRCSCVAVGCGGTAFNCNNPDPTCGPTDPTPPSGGAECTAGSTRLLDCGGNCPATQRRRQNCTNGTWVNAGCENSTSCTTTTPPPTGGGGGGGSKGLGASCNPGQNECASPYVCTQTALGSGVYVCNDPGTGNRCPSGETCTRYLAFRCTTLTATGECLDNKSYHTTWASAVAAAGTCGQVDQVCSQTEQLCGDFQIFTSTCSSGSTPPPTTPPPTVTTYTCNSNYQCVSVSGSGGQYTTLSSCNQNCFEEDAPRCGDTCTTNAQCPNNHVCGSNNRCQLIGCTTSTCLNGCSPLCGGPCNPADANSCPNNHTCSTQTNRCVLNACLTGGVECVNGCSIIPDTSLFAPENSNLLMGLMLILLAIITVRYDLVGKANNLGVFSFNARTADKNSQKINKQREKFEQRFED